MQDDRLLSLTDVMNGMNRLSLNMRLSPPLFQFFWGLIMTGNSLKPRFKNPFDLTVGQAVGIGGGNSRQAVWIKQQGLKKVKIDGQYLVKIKNGNKQKNIPATYDINYELIVPPNLIIPEFDAHQSKNIDSSVDGSVDASATDPLTILRSDQRRGEENNPPNPPDVISEDMGAETDNGGGGDFQSGSEEEETKTARADGLVEDSPEDWITYLVAIMSKPNEKFPPIDILEKATWLVKNNDLELLEECYDAFQQIPVVEVRNRVAFFMAMIEKRGGETIK